MTETETAKYCLECGTPLSYGSRDGKKFCCDKCKNGFHNRKRGFSYSYRLRSIHDLDRNYSILNRLLKLNLDSMDLSHMIILGFRPECVSSCMVGNRRIIYSCYDIQYRISETRVWNIVRIDNTITGPSSGDL